MGWNRALVRDDWLRSAAIIRETSAHNRSEMPHCQPSSAMNNGNTYSEKRKMMTRSEPEKEPKADQSDLEYPFRNSSHERYMRHSATRLPSMTFP